MLRWHASVTAHGFNLGLKGQDLLSLAVKRALIMDWILVQTRYLEIMKRNISIF
jgi:hypothetical protein